MIFLTLFLCQQEIEKNLNTTIRKIFETKGEEYFRKIEEKTTLKKLKLTSTVVSLGGGAFANKNIRNEVLKKIVDTLEMDNILI